MNTFYKDMFVKGTDYKETFRQEVDFLLKQDLTTEFKNELIELLTDAYIDQTDELPDSYELSRLATWLVWEDKIKDPHKVSKTEYPILSHDQIKLRRRRELVSESIGETSNSSKSKLNGRKAPSHFKVFGEYEGGN